MEISTETVTVEGGDEDRIVTLAIEGSDGNFIVVIRTIEVSAYLDQVLAATKNYQRRCCRLNNALLIIHLTPFSQSSILPFEESLTS